jgi:uroporphyrin-III C-methyltransferase
MGKRTFPALAAKLLAQGMSPETPATLAESVGHPEQRLLRTTIGQLAEQLAQETVISTAVILYGALAADQP